MTRLSKTIIGLALLACAAVFIYGFFAEHSKVAHGTPGASSGAMICYLLGGLATLVVLALFIAIYVLHFWGERAKQWALQDGELSGQPVPALEEAERLLKQQQPLDAIGALRAYLQEHPHEYQVMSRIAEIYRDNLHNFLAAALEYEELLKQKVPAEQWGWAALHLATLYARMNQTDKSLDWLDRLQRDYGHTLAAKRARERMAKARSEPGAAAETEGEEGG